ncbi:MAG: hypothetical protein JNM86_14535 [Phycisphaerae bacterium]|nr:hypothetical protein [Phycisphaerae bacterium]
MTKLHPRLVAEATSADIRERAHAAVVEHSPAKALSRGERQTAHNTQTISPSRADCYSLELQSPN